MYSRLLTSTLLALCFLTLAETAAGSAGDTVVSFGVWDVGGAQKFVTSFPAAGVGGPRVVSRLRYPLNAQMREITVEVPMDGGRVIRGSYADGNIQPGYGDDTDWNYTQGQAVWYYGNFRTSGGSRFRSLELVSKNAGFETIVGYRVQSNFMRMRDGRYYIAEYLPVDHVLAGLNSSYDITYAGIWLGVQERRAINDKVTMTGSIYFSPYIEAKAFGNWNLRPMIFEQRGAGRGFEGNIAVAYAPQPHFNVSVGYRYRWLKQAGGVDITDYNDSVFMADWDNAETIQRGIVTKVNYRF